MKAKITIPNIKGFLQGNARMFMSQYFSFKLPVHMDEQIFYRFSIMNEECLKNKACVHCGCAMPNKAFEDRACEASCYPEMKDEKDWDLFKQDNKINIDDVYDHAFHKLEKHNIKTTS